MKNLKLLVILSLIVSSAIYGDIKLDSSKLQNTTIEQGKKGNAIININTPNGKGISVNDFENFQTKNGVVFNNSGQRMNISQLEGIINGNPNITGDQAKLILNRVNGTNRTEIEGAMEAVGRNKVDMIFSSPNGIYLDGAKFIGFKDVTFTTAPVNLDGEGNIQTLTIDKGDIEVGRKGLDASKLEQLALLSKEISIDGEVKGKNLNFIAGDFDYNISDESYVNKEVTKNSISISSSEFGSIYGNQINIIVTNGVIGIKGDIIGNKRIFMDINGGGEINAEIRADKEVYIKQNFPLIINGDISSENDIVIEKNYTMKNNSYTFYYTLLFGKIQAKNITIKNMEINQKISGGVDYGLINYGNIIASGNFKLSSYIANYGSLLVNDIHFIKNRHSHGTISNVKDLIVMNNINSDDNAAGHIINKKNGNIKVYGNVDMFRLDNHDSGFININGDANIKSLISKSDVGHVSITGNLNSISLDNKEGLILVGKDLRTLFFLQDNGTLVASNLYVERKFENKGIINAKNINIEVMDNSCCNFYNSGILNSIGNIEIKSKKIHNEGELNTKNLKLIFKDFSSQGGKITADKITFENYPE